MRYKSSNTIDDEMLAYLEEQYSDMEDFEEMVPTKERGRIDTKKIDDPKERRKQRDERIKRSSKFNRYSDFDIG